mmetsp:Transcript_50877/g.147720  ORF Transcript_50877/g.147720 Transcript_50877/m.147720 type:complete len:261 (-) Transcript_50877:223-1005(-)
MSKAIIRFSPPTASSLPVGENTVACTMSSKRMDPKYLHSSLWAETCHMTVFISWCPAFRVMRPCMSSVPPPPASAQPSGEKPRLRTWPSCRSSATSSMPGRETNTTFVAVVPIASKSCGLEASANESGSPSTSTVPASSFEVVSHTVTEEPESPAAMYLPLGPYATTTTGLLSLTSMVRDLSSTLQSTTVRSSPAATKVRPSELKASPTTSSSCLRRTASRVSDSFKRRGLRSIPSTVEATDRLREVLFTRLCPGGLPPA